MEHRDSPEIEPGSADAPRSSTAQRFTRMIESPSSRRVALPRLAVVGLVALVLACLGVIGVGKLLQALTSYVHQRPEHQIRFDRIELVPEPDPWVVGGKARILEQVRLEAKHGETVSLLDLDLEKLAQDFRRCPWVKDVARIDRTQHGRLVVHLAYRQPVAVIPSQKFKPFAFVLDDEAVVLPDQEIDWTHNEPRYLVKGMAAPLIEIRGVPPASTLPRFGVPWKRKGEGDQPDDPDPMVRRAAALARFLQDRRAELKSPSDTPDIEAIYLIDGPGEFVFLIDADENLVRWGKVVDGDKPGEPTDEARWRMLLEWVQVHGRLVARRPNYLYFTPDGARMGRGRVRP